ncbi:MAG: phosphoribosylformylglycinamidine synthase subunit PurQ [Firmicutes bacterium]|nr:phosphoribosylformylglycinamidine synthase subunit PurQ [Bacillota bacterium]
MRVAVVLFPGANCDRDTLWAFSEVLGEEAFPVPHDRDHLPAADLVVLPGGFSYGDYLRPGAVAARAPVMRAVRRHAAAGGLVLGICNGFQILCEAGLLPGALVANEGGRFVCRSLHLRVESDASPLTSRLRPGEVLRLPVAHAAGNYRLAPGEAERLAAEGRILFRYVDAAGRIRPEANPNGSEGSIAGVAGPGGNVMGLMPHPERAVAPWQGSVDGLRLLRSLRDHLAASPAREVSLP